MTLAADDRFQLPASSRLSCSRRPAILALVNVFTSERRRQVPPVEVVMPRACRSRSRVPIVSPASTRRAQLRTMRPSAGSMTSE